MYFFNVYENRKELFMKKTLIALAVAASAAVSGSAMAGDWVANGIGDGSVTIGGKLIPAGVKTPWEVMTGSATGLDAQVKKGWRVIDIPVKTGIPVLGIRTIDKFPFKGMNGISPQISFNGAINPADFANGETQLSLKVTSASTGNTIGSLSVPLLAGAEYSYTGPGKGKFVMVASKAGDGFFGGLPKDKSGSHKNPYGRLTAISNEFTSRYDNQNCNWAPDNGGFGSWNFTNSKYAYSAYYAAGIEQGQNIHITLNDAVRGDDAIPWLAAIPITVSYQ